MTPYEFNALLNDWIILNQETGAGPEDESLFLVYITLDETASDGRFWLLIDKMIWVDDFSEPNGYRIENHVDQWDCAPLLWDLPQWTRYPLGITAVVSINRVAGRISFPETFKNIPIF